MRDSRARLGLICLTLALGAATAFPRDEERRPWPGELSGVANVREVSGMLNRHGQAVRPGVLVRSGTLAEAGPDAIDALHAYGLKKVVDVRTFDEIEKDGVAPKPFGRKPYLVRMRMDVQEYTRNASELYPRLWNENPHVIRALVQMVADPANQPLILQGQIGVDRVGILVAALLELAEVPREAILDDFVICDRRTPPQFGLEAVFDIWDAQEGGLAGWLTAKAGVHPLTIEAFRHTMFSAELYSQPKDQLAAEKLFQKAHGDALKGRYPQAIKQYEAVSKKYPKTPTGMKAATRTLPNAFLCWEPVVLNGPSRNRIDVVLMGEGYTLKDMPQFDKIVNGVPLFFEQHKIFGEYYSYHNILRTSLRSEEDGVDKLGEDTFSTILGGRDSGAKQGQVAVDHDLVMRQLEEIPDHDRYAAVFAKNGTGGTGGAGVATVGGTSYATLIHEWGHAFAGLMDEYTTDVGYTGEVESGPNVSNTPDPEQVPWRHWLEADPKHIGVYEGAAGRTEGAWKSNPGGCAMEGGTTFCPVCREQIVLRIYTVVDPIDSCDPPHHVTQAEDRYAELLPPLAAEPQMTFKVEVLKPKSHALEVRWWVLPEQSVPAFPDGPGDGYFFGDRKDRGPLSPIESEPMAQTKPNRKGVHIFTLDTTRLERGRYRVICRVKDTTRMKGEKLPWVLHDPHGLLESERGWWLDVKETGG
ncbi:MAG: tyrosine-protein phosphatase [Planctomycetota bacterium]